MTCLPLKKATNHGVSVNADVEVCVVARQWADMEGSQPDLGDMAQVAVLLQKASRTYIAPPEQSCTGLVGPGLGKEEVIAAVAAGKNTSRSYDGMVLTED